MKLAAMKSKDKIEIEWWSRKPKNKPILVSTWYRPPDSNIVLLKCLEESIRRIDGENKEIIIARDVELINACLLNVDYVNPSIKKMKDLIDLYQLQQHIDKQSTESRITHCSHANSFRYYTY